jgi:hypothetical protein
MVASRCTPGFLWCMKISLMAFLLLMPAALGAQKPSGPIQDNSFLLEEAYNQEAGIIQHISVFTRQSGGNWGYGFTQEWPVGGQKNQLSYTIPVLHAAGSPSTTGIGDVLLNYRYQLVGSGETRVAVAPRFSVSLPTGSAAKGFGAGGAGVQVDLPLSWMVTPRLATHWNAGVNVQPTVKFPALPSGSSNTVVLGQSFIYLVTDRLNLMLENVWSRASSKVGGVTTNATSVLVSPGIRYAFNFNSGLQVVPGVAVPIGVGPSSGTTSLLLYLSFEHPLHR